jgi:hypothetical protein
MHITTGITLNLSKDRKEAVGQNMKWNGKLSEPPPAPLREDIQKAGTRSEFNAAGVLRKEGNEEQAFSPSAMSRIPKTAQAKTSWSNWASGRAEIRESIRLSRTI